MTDPTEPAAVTEERDAAADLRNHDAGWEPPNDWHGEGYVMPGWGGDPDTTDPWNDMKPTPRESLTLTPNPPF